MASYSTKAFLILGRINISRSRLQNATNRATYVSVLSMNSPTGNRASCRYQVGVPRTEKMPVDQDWTAVYPSAAPFRPNAVPLPVRMGYPIKGGVAPDKKANLELIKIPNFLHLTPAAIKKHCEALKPFCTEWPLALDTDAKCDEHFPIKVQTTHFVSAGPSLRNPSARIVHLKNYDYAMYLLTVLYHESWKIEGWEAEKTVADMEEYSWENSPSQRNLLDTLTRMKVVEEEGGEEVRQQLLGQAEVQEYKDSVTRLKNEGENEDTLLQYKEAVKKVLKL
uniref:Ribosomal protein S24/S35 mitochondrial conserved domain-containing protein n=1 Tax=Periophthalmus magnuspinnatus TaxID=409849 RepID=A0A3B3ZRF9_9GOBI